MSIKERRFWENIYLSFRELRDAWLKPISDLLIVCKITPNMVTGFRLFLAVIIPILLGWNYWLVVFLMALNLLLDGVDGSMARISKKSNYAGKMFDFVTDNSTFVLFLLGLIFWKLTDGFLAAFYLVNYLVILFLGLRVQNLKKDEFVFSKSRYIVLIAFLILAIEGVNWIDYACVFCGSYLFVHNIFLGYKLIRKL